MNWLALLGLDTFFARWRVAAIEGAIAAEDRMALAKLEWQDQKRYLRRIVVLAMAVAGLTVVSMVMVSMAVLVQFWDTPYRSVTGWVVAGVWLAGWILVVFALLRSVQKAGDGFPLTRRELGQDWRDIKERL
jgi:uncharacterized membrane protein YqjE